MDKQEIIEKLARDTFRRALTETCAGIFVLIVNIYSLQNHPAGSVKYYGCIIVIASVCFTLGIIWSFTVSNRLIKKHPITDSTFWRETLETQSRLLKFVPLWYIAPMTAGILLIIAPANSEGSESFLFRLLIVTAIMIGVAFLNKRSADMLETEALKF